MKPGSLSDATARAALLRAAIGAPGPTEPSSATWARWISVASEERVLPLLYDLSLHAGSSLAAEDVERSRALQVDVAVVSVQLEQSLLQAADVLDAAGIPFVVVKGAATAHLDHQEPGQRQFGDIDLLVAPSSFPAAGRALETNGWYQAYPLPRHHERFTHARTFAGVGIAEIDLHQRIGHRALGLRIPTDELLAGRVAFEVAGRRLWALARPDRFIHAAVHAVASRGQYRRLSSLVDVLVLDRRLTDAEVPALLRRSERWYVRPLVEAAVRLAHEEARLPVPDRWETAMRAPTARRDTLVERAYLGERRRPVIEELAHLRAMDRWRDRGLYVYGHLRMETGPGAGGLGPRLRYLRSRLRTEE